MRSQGGRAARERHPTASTSHPSSLSPAAPEATVDFEATDESILGRILMPVGEVQVGRLIAVLCDDAAAAAALKGMSVEAILKELGEPAGGAAAPAAAAPAAAAAAAPAPAPAAAPAPPAAKAAPAAAAPPPKAAAAAAPAAAAAAAPAASAAAAGPSDGYAAWPAWGTSLARTPMGKALAVQQEAYEALYGFAGVALVDKAEAPAPKKK